MASETKVVNLAEEAKLAREGVTAPSYAFTTICKSLVAGGVAGGVSVPLLNCFFFFSFLFNLSFSGNFDANVNN